MPPRDLKPENMPLEEDVLPAETERLDTAQRLGWPPGEWCE